VEIYKIAKMYIEYVVYKTQYMQSGVNAIKRTGDYLVPYMAPYLMNHYLRKYLIKGELRCSGRVSSSYSTNGTRRAFRKIK
jgi:hypothetical protein